MRFLLDSCTSARAADALRSEGHDVLWAGSFPSDPGDIELLARAHAEQRVLVTLDKDFGELAILRGHPHAGIIRLVDLGVESQAAATSLAAARYASELSTGAVITIERSRTRVRPGPTPPH